MIGRPILCQKVLRALAACLFLALAAWQPGLAAAAAGDGGRLEIAPSGLMHEADGPHDHGGVDIAADTHENAGAGDHHQPSGTDQCCEMHCVMSDAMLASSPLVQAPAAGRFRAGFEHALADGETKPVIKPPKTTS